MTTPLNPRHLERQQAVSQLKRRAGELIDLPILETATDDGTVVKPISPAHLAGAAKALEIAYKIEDGLEESQPESAPDSLPPKKPKKLTDKELAWANAYLETFNKTEAARQAKYKGNDSTLAHIGWENYRKAHIQAYLRQRLEEVAGMSKEETLRLLGDQARFDPLQYARIKSDHRGQWFYIDLIALKEAGLGHLVKELGYDKEGRPIVKFHDAQAAQIQLGKVNGALTTAGESDDKPFIIKVTYGQRTNGSTEEPTS